MEVLVLDTNFTGMKVVDVFESLIWSDRYCGYGDFEIVLSPSDENLFYFVEDRYLYSRESDHLMIIEKLDIKTDIVNGNKLIVTGRSLESILERRIVWDKVVLTGNLQNNIQQLLNDNAINASDANRNITNLIFEASTDPNITSLTLDAQYNSGDNLYSIIVSLCNALNIGFKITLTEANEFEFKLYSGVNRAFDQFDNPYVEFSTNFDNLIHGDYTENKQLLKTVALIAGEKGVGNERTTTSVTISGGGGTGLARREMFVDAGDITRNLPNNEVLNEDQYADLLVQRGIEKLAENIFYKTFEGQIDTTQMFVYGTDFFMGDIVQIIDEYGHTTKSRVSELIHSEDGNGIKTYPSFTAAD